ncbi:MAG: MFS transporter [Oscillospiraceae bacterium]|nr:MFS transporter [Oscillospiraceae bacterium]
MKLNYKRTVCVGFAFFLISAFWQAYDSIIPLILTGKFGLSQTFSGIVMALDNILALFLLPLFGAISDRHRGRFGRRTPFIVLGTVVAAVAFILLSLADNAQLKSLGTAAVIDDPAALSQIYAAEADKTLLTPEGRSFVLSQELTEAEFTAIRSEGDSSGDYTNYVVPARQAYARDVSSAHRTPLILFMLLLLVVLVSMSTFRSPAVALMPDVTVKPLRSKGNAVINLMGAFGGILVLVLGMVFSTGAVKNSLMSYTGFFSIIAGVMLIALGLFVITVNEPRFVKEMQEESRRYDIPEDGDEEEPGGEKHRLGKAEKRSLIFLLLSIVLWFFGYNAVTSKYSVYASSILHKDFNLTLIIAQAAAIVAFLPVGIISSKVGRKKAILAGVVMLAVAFGTFAFLREDSPALLMNALFTLAGVGWATINVNSFPMVVEMSSGAEVGKYTGIYYTASMAAQVATPMVSGFLMDKLGMTVLFPYAAVFAVLAFLTMLAVRHGDSKPEAKRGLEALDVD